MIGVPFNSGNSMGESIFVTDVYIYWKWYEKCQSPNDS